MTNKRIKPVAIAIVLGLLLLLLLFGLMVQGGFFGSGAERDRIVSIPLITTYMENAEGVPQRIQAGFALRFDHVDSQAATQANTAQLQAELTSILHSLDFDSLVARHGVEYVNEEVSRILAARIETEVDVEVFLTDFAHGDRVILSRQDIGEPRREGFLRDIFNF